MAGGGEQRISGTVFPCVERREGARPVDGAGPFPATGNREKPVPGGAPILEAPGTRPDKDARPNWEKSERHLYTKARRTQTRVRLPVEGVSLRRCGRCGTRLLHAWKPAGAGSIKSCR